MLHIVLFGQLPGSLDSMGRMLMSCGMHCQRVDSEPDLMASLRRDPPDIVISHWHTGLPQLETLNKKIKVNNARCKLIVITPRQSGLERGLALHAGIDRYYIEPFSYSRLVYDMGLLQDASQDHVPASVGLFQVNPATQSAWYGSDPLILTRKQFCLLVLLLRHPGQVCSRTQIWETVWGYEDYPSTNCVDALVYRLRKRLPRDAARRLVFVRDIGYRISVDEES